MEYLARFDDCFHRCDTREHLAVYVHGQLSDLPRKSVEPMALKAGVPPRTLQEFLKLWYRWDEDGLRQSLARDGRRRTCPRRVIGIIDETSDTKKGDQDARRTAADTAAPSASKTTASSRCTWAMRWTTFTPCSTVSCFCRRVGRAGSRALPTRGHSRDDGLSAEDRDRLGIVRSRGGARHALRVVDVRRVVRCQTAVLATAAARGQKFVAEIPKDFTAWIKLPR